MKILHNIWLHLNDLGVVNWSPEHHHSTKFSSSISGTQTPKILFILFKREMLMLALKYILLNSQ